MYSKYPLLIYSLVLQMVRIFKYFLSVPPNMIFNQPATPSNVDKREGDVPKVRVPPLDTWVAPSMK